MPDARPPWVEAGSPERGPLVERREIETPPMDPADVVDPDEPTAYQRRGLHRATRTLLKELLAEERRWLGIDQRYVDHAKRKPKDTPQAKSHLNEVKRRVAAQKAVVEDLEKLLKRGERL